MNSKLALLSSFVLVLCPFTLRADQFAVLGSAASYGVLGASTVTNTGPSVISGNLGLYPGTSITGFPPGTVLGTVHNSDAAAQTAQANALTGYNYLAGLAPTQSLTGQDLGGLVLTPGVYFYASSAGLTGALTLDFEGINNADIVFQIGSTLTTASASLINVIDQGTNDNVYFQVGSSATLGTGSIFAGDIIALTSITATTGVSSSCGSLIALNGAVTLDTNVIHNCSATGSDVGGGAGTVPPVPEPASLGLVGTGIVGVLGAFRRRFIA